MNMQNMLQQAKKMQAELEKKEQKLAKQSFTVEKQGVTIKLMGDGTITAVKINSFLIDPDDPETLEDLLIVAFNSVNDLIKEEKDKLAPATSQPGMPF